MTDYSIRVSRAELAKALALVTIGVRKRAFPSEVRFSVVDGFLEIAGPGAAHSIRAQGTWPSAVLTDAGALKRVASKLPSGDPTVMRAENSRLYIGTFSIDAKVLDIAPTSTQLAIGASGSDVLLAVERMGEARVVGSIGMRAFDAAKEELLVCIGNAARYLEPYGVTHEDLASLVRGALQQKALL
jgi:hypothetical protein